MDITDLVSVLPGVGPKRAENLQELGIATIEDLLTYYPFRYDDIQEKDLSEIQDQEKVTLKGLVVSEAVVSRYGYKKSRLTFRMMQNMRSLMFPSSTNLFKRQSSSFRRNCCLWQMGCQEKIIKWHENLSF